MAVHNYDLLTQVFRTLLTLSATDLSAFVSKHFDVNIDPFTDDLTNPKTKLTYTKLTQDIKGCPIELKLDFCKERINNIENIVVKNMITEYNDKSKLSMYSVENDEFYTTGENELNCDFRYMDRVLIKRNFIKELVTNNFSVEHDTIAYFDNRVGKRVHYKTDEPHAYHNIDDLADYQINEMFKEKLVGDTVYTQLLQQNV